MGDEEWRKLSVEDQCVNKVGCCMAITFTVAENMYCTEEHGVWG